MYSTSFDQLPSSSSSSSLLLPPFPRKRTSSFSFSTPTTAAPPRPSKAPRTTTMASLRRTTSFLSLPGIQSDTYTSPITNTSSDRSTLVPYHRTLRYYKEQRERRKALLLSRHAEPITIRTQGASSSTPGATTESPILVRNPKSTSATTTDTSAGAGASAVARQAALPQQTHSHGRTTSPLAPVRTPLPPRTTFPRSKPEPDLYRKAITTRMRCSPEGQKILGMGARLAVSILSATRELERIVAQQSMDVDKEEVVVTDPSSGASSGGGGGTSAPLTNSWVFVPGEDWEMVDCSA